METMVGDGDYLACTIQKPANRKSCTKRLIARSTPPYERPVSFEVQTLVTSQTTIEKLTEALKLVGKERVLWRKCLLQFLSWAVCVLRFRPISPERSPDRNIQIQSYMHVLTHSPTRSVSQWTIRRRTKPTTRTPARVAIYLLAHSLSMLCRGSSS